MVCGSFEVDKLIFHHCEIIASAKLVANAIDFIGFHWVIHSHKRPLVVFGVGGFSLQFLDLTMVVTLFLVVIAVELVTTFLFSRIIWLKRLHDLFSRRNRAMNGAPIRPRLIHERILRTDSLPIVHVFKFPQTVLVFFSELEDLIGLPLLRRLIVSQLDQVITIVEIVFEDLGLTANIVHIWWELRLSPIQETKSFDFRILLSNVMYA